MKLPFAAGLGLLAALSLPAAEPPVGAALLKTDLLGVFAHPDDETGVASLVARTALGDGRVVAHVYCTRGEGGGNMVGTQAGRALGILREAELRACLDRLGVRACHFLDREDFAYTESQSVTLEQWGHEETLERLVRLVRTLRPEVIVTMNPAPTPGQHGNHQAAGRLAVEAFDAAADPGRFPGQILQEGLSPWQVRKLYHGGAGPFTATVTVTTPLPDGRLPAVVAGEALSQHRSQGFGGFAGAPWLGRPQQLQLVKSVVPFQDGEGDLFRGLPVDGPLPPRIPSGWVDPQPAAPVRFLPRPAVARYEEWIREQGVEHTATAFGPDIPVVAGEATPVPIELVGDSDGGRVDFMVPEGWRIEPARLDLGPDRRPPSRFRILQVTPPGTASTDVEIAAAGTVDGREVRVAARLHPVPRLRIPRMDRLPAPDAPVDDAVWAGLPAQGIESTRTWQGRNDGPADSSAEFRIAHDGRRIAVEVRVADDRVVSNIEPDDIRGHWRSDSVELCFDPAPGSEHTLGAFKVGIFPFDRSGRVRGARDADRDAGPVERTAPGTRLWSARVVGGYLIRAWIPLAEIGFDPARGRRIGFNVLVYDGDKEGAAPGENINECRLAWAPRSGVQGRPEDWGRADLDE